MINKTNFALLWSAALQSDNHDRFVSEWAISSIFDDITTATDYVSKVWQVAHMSVRDMRDTTGLSQFKFAELACMPAYTLRNWEQRGGITDYQRLWLAAFLRLLP